MKYRAVYEREPDGRWTVEIPQVPGCHTYGRTIDQARERLREALSLFTDDAASADIEDQVKLPPHVRKTIRNAKHLRETVLQQERKMIEAQINAVRTLRRLKLGNRDTGALLGFSPQRVHQLEHHVQAAGHRVVIAGKRASKKR